MKRLISSLPAIFDLVSILSHPSSDNRLRKALGKVKYFACRECVVFLGHHRDKVLSQCLWTLPETPFLSELSSLPWRRGLTGAFLYNREEQIVCASIRYCAPSATRSSYPHSRDCDRPRESSQRRRRGQSDNGVGGRARGERGPGGAGSNDAQGIGDCMLGVGDGKPCLVSTSKAPNPWVSEAVNQTLIGLQNDVMDLYPAFIPWHMSEKEGKIKIKHSVDSDNEIYK